MDSNAMRQVVAPAYGWSKERTLPTLHAQGQGDELLFTAGPEQARVCLRNGEIESVTVQYGDRPARVIGPDEAGYLRVGEGNWARDVYHWVRPGGELPSLRLGITHHCGMGTWSSLPHDFELHPEPGFEELFFYLLEGGPRRAIQVGRGQWESGEPVDGLWPVHDHSFGVIPMGYHPVVGEPGVRVSYVWAYLAKKPEWEKFK